MPAAPTSMWPPAWTGPWWVERNRREVGQDAAPVGRIGSLPVPTTALGTVSSPARVIVDARGYLSIAGRTWGLDWWIGADDRWHVPAREAAVRQSLVDEAPVVQTSLRVPGGDVHQRLMVVAGPSGAELIIEVDNASAAPVAVAIALRPATAAGPGRIDEVGLCGPILSVDGSTALVLPVPPARMALGDGGETDLFVVVSGGGAVDGSDQVRRSTSGLATAVVLVPLAHRARWRARVPVDASEEAPVGRPRPRWRRPGPEAPVATAPVARSPVVGPGPEVATVTRGWASLVDAGLRLDLPAGQATGALRAIRGHLLLAAGAPSGAPGAAAEVAVAAATAGLGRVDPTDLVVAALGGHRRTPGPGGVAPALWAAEVLTGLGAAPLASAVVATAAEVAAGARGADSDPVARTWRAAGLAASASLLEAAGERRAASTASAWAAIARQEVDAGGGDPGLARCLAVAAGRIPLTRAPDGLGDPTTAEGLRMVAPGAGAPGVGASGVGASGVGASGVGASGVGASGVGAQAVWAAACGRDGRWLGSADVLVAAGSPTVTWDDAGIPARLWSSVRAALLAEEPDGLVLLPAWPPGWLGQALEVHGMPSRWGAVSFALRWHGPRPALLWSIERAPAHLRITAPVLGPRWASAKDRGEALFEPPQPAPG